MIDVEFNESKALKHSNSYKLEYIGKCLLVRNGEMKVLVVGDLHFGYGESMEVSGVAVSRSIFEDVRKDFEEIFEKTGKVDEIVLLGDIKHGFGRISNQEWEEIGKLIDYLIKNCHKIKIVRGNHDNYILNIAGKKNIDVVDYYICEDVCFLHGDKNYELAWNTKIKMIVVGHGHPAVKISDGTKVEKYKCFLDGKYKGKRLIVVPSFFGVNEGSDFREYDLGLAWKINWKKFKVFVVGDNLEVFDFGIGKEIS